MAKDEKRVVFQVNKPRLTFYSLNKQSHDLQLSEGNLLMQGIWFPKERKREDVKRIRVKKSKRWFNSMISIVLGLTPPPPTQTEQDVLATITTAGLILRVGKLLHFNNVLDIPEPPCAVPTACRIEELSPEDKAVSVESVRTVLPLKNKFKMH